MVLVLVVVIVLSWGHSMGGSGDQEVDVVPGDYFHYLGDQNDESYVESEVVAKILLLSRRKGADTSEV